MVVEFHAVPGVAAVAAAPAAVAVAQADVDHDELVVENADAEVVGVPAVDAAAVDNVVAVFVHADVDVVAGDLAGVAVPLFAGDFVDLGKAHE